MSTIPPTVLGKLEFFEAHLPVWAADPVAIGLTAIQVSDLAALVAAARTEFDAVVAIRNSARAATESRNNAIAAMFALGSDYVKTIRAFAETTSDPGVYVAAEIPAPAPPTPLGPPAAPTGLVISLRPTGGLLLKWKGTLAKGAYFSVYRRAEGESDFTLLDSPDAKEYEDTNIPAGVNQLTYYIQARRDDFRVDSVQYTVNFAAGGTSITTMALAA